MCDWATCGDRIPPRPLRVRVWRELRGYVDGWRVSPRWILMDDGGGMKWDECEFDGCYVDGCTQDEIPT
jgi:hypothetical protein